MLVRKPLNAVGLDIVRLRPSPRRLELSEATKFLWLSSLKSTLSLMQALTSVSLR